MDPSPTSPLPQPVSMLINAHSRRGRMMLPRAEAAVREAGIPLGQIHVLSDHATTARLLQQEIAAGSRTVIIGGGDGTLSTCADHLAHSEVAMGVLPLGTGNTFARTIGLPLELEAAAKVIAEGHIEAVDVGRVNNQIFLNSVSLGLSCEIAEALDGPTKKRLGLLAWPVVGAKVIYRHRPLQLKVTAAEKTYKVRTHQLLVVNGRYVAGPIVAAPDASVQDETFDVFVLGGAKHSSLFKATLNWLLGRHVNQPETRYFTTSALSIESMRKPLRANIDGEVNETTPLEIEMLPAALRVVVPRDFKADEV